MAAMRDNMRWDGYFHAAVWVITLVGAYSLLAAARKGPLPHRTAFTGHLLVGWGLFNLVEGLVDHHLLGLHHVRDLPAHVPIYDWLFLAIGGIGCIAAGWLLGRRAPGQNLWASRPAPRR